MVHPQWQGSWTAGGKVVSLSAKRERCLMAQYAIEHRITDTEDLKGFKLEGYAYDAAASDRDHWYFRREQP